MPGSYESVLAYVALLCIFDTPNFHTVAAPRRTSVTGSWPLVSRTAHLRPFLIHPLVGPVSPASLTIRTPARSSTCLGTRYHMAVVCACSASSSSPCVSDSSGSGGAPLASGQWLIRLIGSCHSVPLLLAFFSSISIFVLSHIVLGVHCFPRRGRQRCTAALPSTPSCRVALIVVATRVAGQVRPSWEMFHPCGCSRCLPLFPQGRDCFLLRRRLLRHCFVLDWYLPHEFSVFIWHKRLRLFITFFVFKLLTLLYV